MDSSGNGTGQQIDEAPHSVTGYGMESQEEIPHSLGGYALEAPQPDSRNLMTGGPGSLRVSPVGEVEVSSTQDHLTEAMYAEQVSRMQLNEVTRAQLGEVVRAQLNEAAYREHLETQSVHSSHGSGPPSVGPVHNVSGPPSVQMVDNSSPETYQQPGTPMVEHADMVATVSAQSGGMHLAVAVPSVLNTQPPGTPDLTQSSSVGHLSAMSRVSSVSHTPELCPSPSVSQAQPINKGSMSHISDMSHSPSPSVCHDLSQAVTQITTLSQSYNISSLYSNSTIPTPSTSSQQYTPLPRIQDLRQPGLEHIFPATFPYNPATGTFYPTSTQYAPAPVRTEYDQTQYTHTSGNDTTIAAVYDTNSQYYTSAGQFSHQLLSSQDVSSLASYLSPTKLESSAGMQLPLSTTQYSIATSQIGLGYAEPQTVAGHSQQVAGRLVSGTPEPSSSADGSVPGSPMPPATAAPSYESQTLQVYSNRNLQDSSSPSPLPIGNFPNQPTLGSQVFPPYVQEKQAQHQRLAVATPPVAGQSESPTSMERMVAATIMNRHPHAQLPVHPPESSLPIERLVADSIMKRHSHLPTSTQGSTSVERLESSLPMDRLVVEAVMKHHAPAAMQPESSLPIERIVAAAIMRQHALSPPNPEPSLPVERIVADALIRRNSRSPAQAQPESSTPVEHLIAEAIMKRHMRSPSPVNLPDLQHIQVHAKPENMTQQEQPDSTVNDTHRLDPHLLSYQQTMSVLPPIATVALARTGRVAPSTHGAKLPVLPPVRAEAMESEIQQPESSGRLDDGILVGEMQTGSVVQPSTSADHLDFKEEVPSDVEEVVLQDIPANVTVMGLEKVKSIQKRDEQKKLDEKRNIKDTWFNEFPWLLVDRERKLFFCRYCKQVDNDSIFAKGRSTLKPKKDYFQKHETTEVHLGAMSELGVAPPTTPSGGQNGDPSQDRPPTNASVFPWPEQGSAGSLANMVGDLIDFAKMEMAGSSDHPGAGPEPGMIALAMNAPHLGNAASATGEKASQATGEEACLIDYSNVEMLRYLNSQITGLDKQHMALELFGEFPWLILDAEKDCLYCKACLRENKNSLLAIGKPATNMVRENLVRHEENPYHQEAMQKVGDLGIGPIALPRDVPTQQEMNQAFKKRKRNRIDPNQLQTHSYSLRQVKKKSKDDGTEDPLETCIPTTPVSRQQMTADGEVESIHKRMYFRRRIRAQWFLDFPWLELNQLEARFYCKLCRKYDQPGVFCTGKPVVNPKRDNLVKHEDTEGHRIAVLQEAGMSAEDAMHSVLISEADAKAQREALAETQNALGSDGQSESFTQQMVMELLLEYPWLELKEKDQKFFCKYCCAHNQHGLFSNGKPAQSPKQDEFKKHEETEGHKMALRAYNIGMSSDGNLHLLSLQGRDLLGQTSPNNATTPTKRTSKLDWFSAFPWLRLEPDCLTVYCMPCREDKAQGELSTGKPVSSLRQEECQTHEDFTDHKVAVEHFKVKHPEIPVEASPSLLGEGGHGQGDQSPDASSSLESAETPWTTMFWQFASQMRQLGLLCDITLSVGSKDGGITEFRAHKLILVSGSEYFKTCLRASSVMDCYHFDNLTPAGLEGILDYLYGQHMQLFMKPQHYVEYYHAANALMVPKARELVERLMILSALQCSNSGPQAADATSEQPTEDVAAKTAPVETQQHIIDYERVRQEFRQGTADANTMYDLGSRAAISKPVVVEPEIEIVTQEAEPEALVESPAKLDVKPECPAASLPVPPKKKNLARAKAQGGLVSSGPVGSGKRTRGRPPKTLSEVQRRTTVGTGFNTKKKPTPKDDNKSVQEPAIPKYEYAAERKRMLSKVLPTCNICGKKFLRQSFLLRHKEIKHMRPQVKPSFECPDCDKTFSSRHDLKVHRRRHTGERPYLCTECGKAFTRKETLVEHSYTHKPDSEKPHRCEECGKGFFKIFDLRRHYIGIHSGKRPFMCHLCGKAFPWARSLRDHLAAHQADRKRPFKCDECDMTFVRKYDLTRHSVTHTKEKPFKCEWCGHGFTQKGSKDKHKREFCRNKPGGLPQPLPPEGVAEVESSEGDPNCGPPRDVLLPTVQQYEATMQQAMSCLLSGPVYQAGWENKPFTIPGNPL